MSLWKTRISNAWIKKGGILSSEGEENRKNRSAKNSGGRMRNARRVGMRGCAPNTSFGM